MTTACWAEDLRGHDKLRLLVIEPSVTAKGQDRRFHCPVPGCTYVGATLGHAGDCLKHLKDTKHGPVGHAEFWRNTFVCFKNADGKGLLNTRPCYDSGPFAFAEPGDDRPKVAYTKVCAQVLRNLSAHAASHMQNTSLACSWGLRAACVQQVTHLWSRRARAVPEDSVSATWCLKP